MKSLANCKPTEFLKQSNKIRKSVSKWLTLTGVQEIRKQLPAIPEGADDEEMRSLIRDQAIKNANKIIEIILEKYPEETLELLGLLCFVEPEDIDNHTVAEYLGCFKDLISNEDVIGFFISLISLGRIDI